MSPSIDYRPARHGDDGALRTMEELLRKILRELESVSANVQKLQLDSERLVELSRKQTRLLGRIERNTS